MSDRQAPERDVSSEGTDQPSAIDPVALLARLEEAQKQLDFVCEQLTESQRLATIGTIAATIAHEFNNLLTPVMSYAQFALTSAESDKPDMELIRKALHKSYAGCERAGRICGSMLSLARGEAGEARCDLKTAVEDTLGVMAREPHKDGIALRVQVPPGLIVKIDPVHIGQVLLNLLINARQAMGKGSGKLTVTAEDAGDGFVAIRVADTGCGIPERSLGKIFDPFFTTKGTAPRGGHRGTGLGLSICRQIIEHTGGTITVESKVDQGTTFTLRLPTA